MTISSIFWSSWGPMKLVYLGDLSSTSGFLKRKYYIVLFHIGWKIPKNVQKWEHQMKYWGIVKIRFCLFSDFFSIFFYILRTEFSIFFIAENKHGAEHVLKILKCFSLFPTLRAQKRPKMSTDSQFWSFFGIL